jgi:hypothetical protein
MMKFTQIAAAGDDESTVLYALGEDGNVYEYVTRQVSIPGQRANETTIEWRD